MGGSADAEGGGSMGVELLRVVVGMSVEAEGLVWVSWVDVVVLGRDKCSCLRCSMIWAIGAAIMVTEAWSLASSSAERRACSCAWDRARSAREAFAAARRSAAFLASSSFCCRRSSACWVVILRRRSTRRVCSSSWSSSARNLRA